MSSSEERVLEILREEKENRVIRQISPIYDTKRLGYSSTLVSFKIRKEDISDAVKIINSHPGVSHEVMRGNTHLYLVYSRLVPCDSSLG